MKNVPPAVVQAHLAVLHDGHTSLSAYGTCAGPCCSLVTSGKCDADLVRRNTACLAQTAAGSLKGLNMTKTCVWGHICYARDLEGR